jgi:hypothetical protein
MLKQYGNNELSRLRKAQPDCYEFEVPRVHRVIWLLFGIMLVVNPYILLAQRRGGRSAGAAPPPAGAPNNDALKDFNRAVAVQATPGQVIRFRQSCKSVQAAREKIQHLLQLPENTSKSDLLPSRDSLITALKEARTENESFLQSFSAVQKSGLKDPAKMLRKADSDVTKKSDVLAHDLERSGAAGPRISVAARKLDEATSNLQAQQLALGIQMGIPNEAGSK